MNMRDCRLPCPSQPFDQITHLTDVAEGTIVRVITRLDETCREVRDAARVIGDMDLFKKMEEAQIKIKRDSKSAAGPSFTSIYALSLVFCSCLCCFFVLLSFESMVERSKLCAGTDVMHRTHSLDRR